MKPKSGLAVAKKGSMMTRAAALTATLSLLAASSAFAGASSRPFMVGAVVVRSATVSATVSATAVQVQQVASRGTPAPMLLVAGRLKSVPQAGAVQLSAASSGD